MTTVDMTSLENIVFCGHMNENVCDLGNVIKSIKAKRISIQFEYKEAAGQEMRSVDVSDSIDDDKFMIEQLIMKKEKDRSYIMRKVTQ